MVKKRKKKQIALVRIRGKCRRVQVIGKGSTNPRAIGYNYAKVKTTKGEIHIVPPYNFGCKRKR